MKKNFLIFIFIFFILFIFVNVNIFAIFINKNLLNFKKNNFFLKKQYSINNPFNKIDNKLYFIIWRPNKNENWIITKFINNKFINNNLNFILIFNFNNYVLRLFKYWSNNGLIINLNILKKYNNKFIFSYYWNSIDKNNFKNIFILLSNNKNNKINFKDIKLPIINPKTGEIINND